MRVAITDLIPTKPEMSVVALVVPYATVVVAAYVDRQVGKKYDIDLSQGVGTAIKSGFSSYSKAYSTWAYAEAAFDYWAGLLRKRLDEVHGR